MSRPLAKTCLLWFFLVANSGFPQSTTSLVFKEISEQETREKGINHLLEMDQNSQEQMLEQLLDKTFQLPSSTIYRLQHLIASGKVKLTTNTLNLLMLGLDDPATEIMCVQSLQYIRDPLYGPLMSKKVIKRLRTTSDSTSVTVDLLFALAETCFDTSSSVSLARDYFRDFKKDIAVRGVAGSLIVRCAGIEALMRELDEIDENGTILGLSLTSTAVQISNEDFNPSIAERAIIKDFVLNKFQSPSPSVRKAAVLAIYGLAQDMGPGKTATWGNSSPENRALRKQYLEKLNELKLNETETSVLNAINELTEYLRKTAN